MNQSEQAAHTGTGPLIERRYSIDLLHPARDLDEVFAYVKCHIEEFSPDLLAEFEKVKGAPGGLALGHEYTIKLLGPWNGSVRVTAVEEREFEFCTLQGHPEAGRIRFGVQPLPVEGGGYRFSIHSWARSRDGLVAFAYSTLGVGKRMQEEAWVMFCQRVAAYSGGESSPVRVETVEYDGDTLAADRHART